MGHSAMDAPSLSRTFSRIAEWNQAQLGGMRRAAARLRDSLRGLREAQSGWRRAKREVDRRFDAELGVDTGGITAVRFLDVPEHRRACAVDHIAIDPTEFTRALAALPVEPDAFTFVDFGSGKGRAVLLAAQQRFQRVIGVELAPELHQISKRNVQAGLTEQRRADVELHCMDACEFELPDVPLVLYLYHPFGPEVLAPLVHRVVASYQRAPRPIFVIYLNPFHQQLWTDAGFLVCAADANYAILAAERVASQARPTESTAPEAEPQLP
jgi:SAM-dependent methyltransferase